MKLLAVYDTKTKRLQGLAPSKATGVPIPAFRSGLALPRAGTTQGEAFINTNTGEASVWSGTQWNPIAKPVVSRYPTESALLQDNPQDGTVGMALNTGNVFSMVNGAWRAMGARTFPTTLARDASQDYPGTIAFVEATGEWSLRIPSGFVQPEHNPIGTPAASESDLGTAVATILAAGRVGAWVQLDPGYNYPGAVGGGTINELPQAMSGANGDWVIYDGVQFIQVQGNINAAGTPIATGNPVWAMLNQQTVNVGPTPSPNPRIGEQWFDSASNTLFTWDGTIWRPPSTGIPLGTIISHASVTPPAGYLLCNGDPIPPGAQFDPLRALIGNNVPDLNDQFLRGHHFQADIDGFTKRADTTRLPRTAFTGETDTTGRHDHSVKLKTGWSQINGSDVDWSRASAAGTGQYNGDGHPLWPAGNHKHTVTINGGGDAETAPKCVYVAFHIRAIQ